MRRCGGEKFTGRRGPRRSNDLPRGVVANTVAACEAAAEAVAAAAAAAAAEAAAARAVSGGGVAERCEASEASRSNAEAEMVSSCLSSSRRRCRIEASETPVGGRAGERSPSAALISASLASFAAFASAVACAAFASATLFSSSAAMAASASGCAEMSAARAAAARAAVMAAAETSTPAPSCSSASPSSEEGSRSRRSRAAVRLELVSCRLLVAATASWAYTASFLCAHQCRSIASSSSCSREATGGGAAAGASMSPTSPDATLW